MIEKENKSQTQKPQQKTQTQQINKNYKITIDKWWESATYTCFGNGEKAIILRTKKEVEILLKVFDKKQITVFNKNKIKNSKFDIFIFNDLEGRFYGGNSYVDYEDKKRLKKMHPHTEFYNFDEIDFTDYLTQEEIDELKKIKRFKIL